jgi:hypothetical protein
MTGTGGGDGEKLGIEALRELIFGDYSFDSNPAATGRSFLFLVRDYVMMVWFPGCAVFFPPGRKFQGIEPNSQRCLNCKEKQKRQKSQKIDPKGTF